MLCWNGTSWSALPSPTPERLLSIWGRGAGDIWVAGDKGRAFRWDGKRWNAIDTGTSESLTWVRGTAHAVWIFGTRNTARYVDAGGVKTVPNGWLSAGPRAVLASQDEDLIVYGPPLLRARRGTLEPAPKELDDLVKQVRDVHAIASSPQAGLWVNGDEHLVRLQGGARQDGVAVLGSYRLWVGPRDDVWAAGPRGLVHRQAGAWKFSLAHLPAALAITALDGDAQNLWAVGPGRG